MEVYAMDILYVVNVERREPNHTTTDCKLNNRCANCSEDHPFYTRTCPIWKKKILTVKHARNIPYPEAQK